MKQVWVLSGEGIECEKESFRFFSAPQLKLKTKYLNLPDLLHNPEQSLSSMNKGDWVLFPGGFSFADHLGSGRLLSFKLAQAKVYAGLLKKGIHMLGICNGFQILTAASLFGDNLSLEKNSGASFRNQWVELKGWKNQNFFFTCRHGEGRLVVNGKLDSDVRVLMRYNDSNFNNGSFDNIAGLAKKHGESWVVGLMPHPEISLRAMDGPDFVGGEYPGNFGLEQESKMGEGIRFFEELQKDIEEGTL